MPQIQSLDFVFWRILLCSIISFFLFLLPLHSYGLCTAESPKFHFFITSAIFRTFCRLSCALQKTDGLVCSNVGLLPMKRSTANAMSFDIFWICFLFVFFSFFIARKSVWTLFLFDFRLSPTLLFPCLLLF